jgi:hypothetical protein
MPALIGLPVTEAVARLGELEASAHLELSSEWGRPVSVRCEARPGVIVWQAPEPRAPLTSKGVVHIRTAALDLGTFRGPCAPVDGDLGPLAGPDADLARAFYRFAADPSLDAPFADGRIWVGIESGPTATLLDRSERADLSSWQVGSSYAERNGPISALDVVASSGGYYELHQGVVGTCPREQGEAPGELTGLRAISLTAPSDTVNSCIDWWGVTLFLTEGDEIRGVALRLGSP